MAGPFQQARHCPGPAAVGGYAPGMGILEHVGRKSGKPYRTPLNVFPTDDGVAILLTYGPDRDWLKNISATGQARMKRMGKTIELADPRVVTKAEAAAQVTGFWRPIGCQLPIADLSGLRGDAVLHVSMVPQHPQRVGQRRCGGVVAGKHEDEQVVADVVVGQRPPGFWVGGRDQRVHERCIAGRIGAARLQDLLCDPAHRSDRGTSAAPRRSR